MTKTLNSNIDCYNSTVEVTHSRMKRWWRRVIRRRIHKEIETLEKNPWFVRGFGRQETRAEEEEDDEEEETSTLW